MAIPMQFGSGVSGGETGISMRLVWTNPSPSSNFAAQTLALELGNYDAVVIYVKQDTSTNYGAFCFAAMDINTTIFTKGQTNGTMFGRYITASGAGITFSNGYSGSSTGAQYAIPLYVYGIKGIR